MNILITGASRGIGKAIAEAFKGHNVFKTTFDVRDRGQVKMSAFRYKEMNSDFYLDVIINNAGIRRDRTFAKMTDEEWDDVLNTNLTGVYNVTKAFLPLLRDGGCIINIGSIIGSTGNFGQTNYSASKAGLLAMTKSLAMELAKRNVRVNMVSPSIVDTLIYKDLTPEQRKSLVDRTLLKRMATPEEIAKFVKFLVEDGTYCTGENYIVGGGFK